MALDSLEQETRLLPALADRLSVPVPRPLGWASAPEILAGPFADDPLLKGTTADHARCDHLTWACGRWVEALEGG